MSRALFVLLPNFGCPLAFNLHSDARILLFVTAVAVVVTLVCGMYPVRQSLRVSQNEALHEGGAAVAGGSRSRFGQRILLGLQLGICFVVLVCCGLLTRTALNDLHARYRFRSCQLSHRELRSFTLGIQPGTRARISDGTARSSCATPPASPGPRSLHIYPWATMGSGNTRNFSIPGYVPAKGEEMAVITDFEGPISFTPWASSCSRAAISMCMTLPALPESQSSTSHGPPLLAQRRCHRPATLSWRQAATAVVGVVHDYAYHNPDSTDPVPVVSYRCF